MKAREVLLRVEKVLRDKPKLENLHKEVKTLSDWVSPSLDTKNLVKVTFCESCINYKRYRNKFDGTIKSLCCLDKSEKDSKQYYCAKAVRKEVEK